MKTLIHTPIKRRQFLAGAGTAALVTGFPAVLRAQEPEAIRLGLVHPVTGFVSFSGTQCRVGAEMAIADISAMRRHPVDERRQARGDAGRQPGPSRARRLRDGAAHRRWGDRHHHAAIRRRSRSPPRRSGQDHDAAHRRCRRRRQHHPAQSRKHVPLRARLRLGGEFGRRGAEGNQCQWRRQDRRHHPRGIAVRHRHGRTSGQGTAEYRHRGAGSHPPRQPDARLHQHRASTPLAPAGPDHSGQLLQ